MLGFVASSAEAPGTEQGRIDRELDELGIRF